MAQITVPRFFPQPWAANELMTPLTAEEMAIGYPSGTSDKPTRQSINNALQYAINGVLYYLTTGVPAWVLDAEYSVGSIVMFSGGYFYSTADANIGQAPDTLVGWEKLPWRKADLDALFMTQEQADARFLSLESGDLRYYTQAAANALFLTQANAAAQFVTKAALEANFLTTEQANALFLTQAQADLRYALRTDVVNRVTLSETLADFETRASAAATFMTPEQAEERFMTAEDAAAIFETQVDARATFLALEDAGLRIYRGNITFNQGALVLDRGSSIIYVSQADDNLNNSPLDPAWWLPWLTPIAVDQNGLFLNSLTFDDYGDFTVNAADIPMLATHPDGIFLRIVMKGSGGYGGDGVGLGIAQGGGEGATGDVILREITKEMFPLNISIAAHAETVVRFSSAVYLTIAPGEDGTALATGAGGSGEPIWSNPPAAISASVLIPGATGKWGIPGVRGGDGGGVHGGSGAINAVTEATEQFQQGRRGCGGGGSNPNGQYHGAGGPGYLQIFW